jgi:hypothetical protein
MSDDETLPKKPLLPRGSFAPEVFPRVYSTQELTPKETEFFEAIRKYDLSSFDAEASGFRYCGGDTHSNDINYYRMCFPGQSFPLEEEKCVCKHSIVVNCYITNAEKTILAVLGRCCIKKFLGGVARRCEQCGETHTNRTKNLCRVCIREYRESLKESRREEKAKLREQSREEKRLSKEREKEEKRLRREEFKLQKEEWKNNLNPARNILKEYRARYAKKRRWIPPNEVGKKKFNCPVCRCRESLYPDTMCPNCEIGPSSNYINDVIRLRLLILLWPLIKEHKYDKEYEYWKFKAEIRDNLLMNRDEDDKLSQVKYKAEYKRLKKQREKEQERDRLLIQKELTRFQNEQKEREVKAELERLVKEENSKKQFLAIQNAKIKLSER